MSIAKFSTKAEQMKLLVKHWPKFGNSFVLLSYNLSQDIMNDLKLKLVSEFLDWPPIRLNTLTHKQTCLMSSPSAATCQRTCCDLGNGLCKTRVGLVNAQVFSHTPSSETDMACLINAVSLIWECQFIPRLGQQWVRAKVGLPHEWVVCRTQSILSHTHASKSK